MRPPTEIAGDLYTAYTLKSITLFIFGSDIDLEPIISTNVKCQ